VHRISLDLEAECKDRMECVCKLKDADRTDEAGDVGELRDGGADYPCESLVRRDERHLEELSCFGGEGWGA
jgi:hypothetical protein